MTKSGNLMIENYDIVCIGLTKWDSLWTRKQYFMSMLAENENRILYVDPVYGFLSKWTKPDFGKLTMRWQPTLTPVSRNLQVLSPPSLLPARRRVSLFNYLNEKVLSHWLTWALRKLEIESAILWLYNPLSSALSLSDTWKLVVYECTDEHAAFPGTNARLVRRHEQRLIKQADVVIVTAPDLLDSRRRLNPNTHFVPNGVDVSLFRQAHSAHHPTPQELVDLRKPIIGYVGAIGEWFDLELVENLARERPGWSFVLLGPVVGRLNLNALHKHKNVFVLGQRAREDLPAYLASFDVCINPFKLNSLTKSVNPLKVYEYLCAGKPTVSVDLPALRDLKQVVYLAKDRHEFLAGIEAMLAQNTPEWAERRSLAAQDYSWESLLERVSRIVHQTMNVKEAKQ